MFHENKVWGPPPSFFPPAGLCFTGCEGPFFGGALIWRDWGVLLREVFCFSPRGGPPPLSPEIGGSPVFFVGGLRSQGGVFSQALCFSRPIGLSPPFPQ